MNKTFKAILQISIITCFMFMMGIPTASAAYFDPGGGTYYGPVYTEVYFGLNPTFYTTDGTDPRTSDTRILGRYYLDTYIDKTITFRVVVCSGNIEHALVPDGPEYTSSYVINNTIPDPVFNLPSGTYTGPQLVKTSIQLENNYDNLTGWYTIDGSDPRTSGTSKQFYNVSANREDIILIESTATMKVAYKVEYKSHSFWLDQATNYWSPVVTAFYEIK